MNDPKTKIMLPDSFNREFCEAIATISHRLSTGGDSVIFHGDANDPRWYVIRSKPIAALDDLEPPERRGRAECEAWMKTHGMDWGFAAITSEAGAGPPPEETVQEEFHSLDLDRHEESVDQLNELRERIENHPGVLRADLYPVAMKGRKVLSEGQMAELFLYLEEEDALDSKMRFPIVAYSGRTKRILGLRLEVLSEEMLMTEEEKFIFQAMKVFQDKDTGRRPDEDS